MSAELTKDAYAFKDFDISRFLPLGLKASLPRASSSFLRAANSASLNFTLMLRAGISISIMSPSFTKPILPPDAASGEM